MTSRGTLNSIRNPSRVCDVSPSCSGESIAWPRVRKDGLFWLELDDGRQILCVIHSEDECPSQAEAIDDDDSGDGHRLE